MDDKNVIDVIKHEEQTKKKRAAFILQHSYKNRQRRVTREQWQVQRLAIKRKNKNYYYFNVHR